MSKKYFAVKDIHQLVVKALTNHKTASEHADQIADALVAAEIDGQKGHGLSRLPSYCEQAASGKVNGFISPVVSQVATAAIVVDARYGFAYPALARAVDEMVKLTPKTGIAVAAVKNSHHCGMAGYHVEKLARKGLVGLLFANTPKAIAPWGGQRGIFGTNPIALAVPRQSREPMVIDLALSKVARGKIMIAARDNKEIPEGWALDATGQSTTDPKAALAGTMAPIGGAKGAALVLIVEILAAALTASNFGFEATSFFEADGKSPGVGQLLVAFAPEPLSGGQFSIKVESLFKEILSQGNTRLPGERKLTLRQAAAQKGISLTGAQHALIQKLAGESSKA
ncbi:MAG: sulfolactate dehydrogenase [Desulfobulbus propionicus]|nr:MAG: sulfolactate dehydrogenase [Desulfobulbus propionicus]